MGAIPCAAGGAPVPVGTAAAATTSGLTYDEAVQRYTYVWKTPKGAGGCVRLTLTLADGTAHSADFQFK